MKIRNKPYGSLEEVWEEKSVLLKDEYNKVTMFMLTCINYVHLNRPLSLQAWNKFIWLKGIA